MPVPEFLIRQIGIVKSEIKTLAEDCWGDRTWNPKWYVAHASTPDGWTAEFAIPLNELTGDPLSLGKAWACNVVRVLPGRGVQAWSLPAEVQRAAQGVPGVTGVKLELTFEPPWTKDRMSEAAKLALGLEDIIPIARIRR